MHTRSASLTFEAMAAEYLERMGARMRERRESLDLSRDEVAKRMPGKTNGNAIYRWERGEHRPHPDTMEALAEVLEVEVSYFLAPEPQPGTGDLMEVIREDDAVNQFDRMEAKLDRILTLMGETDPAEITEPLVTEAEADLAADAGGQPADGSGERSDAKPASRRPRSPGKQAAS